MLTETRGRVVGLMRTHRLTASWMREMLSYRGIEISTSYFSRIITGSCAVNDTTKIVLMDCIEILENYERIKPQIYGTENN